MEGGTEVSGKTVFQFVYKQDITISKKQILYIIIQYYSFIQKFT